MRKPIVREHGTPKGYGQHKRAKTKPCIPCLDANARYKQAWKIRAKRMKVVPVRVDVLTDLLHGEDVHRTLREALGREVVEALRLRRPSKAMVANG